jgi:hypothetical protein
MVIAYDELERAVRVGSPPEWQPANNQEFDDEQMDIAEGRRKPRRMRRFADAVHSMDFGSMLASGTQNFVAFGRWASIADAPEKPGTRNAFSVARQGDLWTAVRTAPAKPQLVVTLKAVENPKDPQEGQMIHACTAEKVLGSAGAYGRRIHAHYTHRDGKPEYNIFDGPVAVPRSPSGTRLVACLGERAGESYGMGSQGQHILFAESSGDITLPTAEVAIAEALDALRAAGAF